MSMNNSEVIKCRTCPNIISPINEDNDTTQDKNYWICSHHNYYCVCCFSDTIGFSVNYNYKCDICEHVHHTISYKAYMCKHISCPKVIRVYKFCNCCFLDLEKPEQSFQDKLQEIIHNLHKKDRKEHILNSIRFSQQCVLSKKLYCSEHLVSCILCNKPVYETFIKPDINVCFRCYFKVKRVQHHVMPIIYNPKSLYIKGIADNWESYKTKLKNDILDI